MKDLSLTNQLLTNSEVNRAGLISLPQFIKQWALSQPDARALVFLPEGEGQGYNVTYAELLERSQCVANYLLAQGMQGKRLLLLLPSGIDYVVAFLGCLMAKAIAVPLYPPRNNWHDTRLAAISNDAHAVCAITHSSVSVGLLKRLQLAGASAVQTLINIDQVEPRAERAPFDQTSGQDIAYLQYTSGSTGNPKGVVIRHEHLVRNAELYCQAVGLRHKEIAVSWLPLFHDMGLVQGLVMPMVVGGTAVFMPPTAFIQDPMRWLRAIDRFRAVFSGGPNFAYQLCIDSAGATTAEVLDLSCWRIALNAAEPISADTVESFAQTFASQGLRRGALVGGFGMAEATLYVTAGASMEGAPVLHLNKFDLAAGAVRIEPTASAATSPIVSSGQMGVDPMVCIVDPVDGQELDPHKVGEIWVAGSSVSSEYWQNPEESARCFGHSLVSQPGRYFLRTGDLGFSYDGHLYVTGRLKDLIIVRGANHYPQDIERDVENSQPMFRTGGFCAAFTLDETGSNILVVVQEVKRTERRKVDIDVLGPRVASLIAGQHGIELGMLVLIEPTALPKTSSGKIQRKACRDMLLQGKLKEIARWQRASPHVVNSLNGSQTADQAEIEKLLSELVVELSGLTAEVCTREASFNELGLDSSKLVLLTVRAGHALGLPISPATLFEYTSIDSLARHLAGNSQQSISANAKLAHPVAIVGMACRLPGADSLQALWGLLERGESAVGKISTQRRILTDYEAEEDAPQAFLGELPEVQAFDAQLFGIAAREMLSMDPQQRLMLEMAWHALEDAGIAPDSLAETSTGVYLGISTNDYFRLQYDSGHDAYSGTGGALSIAANRISYCLGLQGPSLALDTACSSSLVAVHQACQALAVGDCDSAIAGGVNVVLSADFGDIFAQAQMLSPDGRCKTFDQAANGYVRGEGAGAVVLKRLCDAQRDGDRIHAVIRGSAINQDGRSNGLTAPNGLAQRRVIQAALVRAGVEAASIEYVETHGTGTPLGDPIEVAALKEVYGHTSDRPCRLGALKTNIGHLEAAAGIAGLIKTVLVLERGRIPANHGFEKLNPLIDLAGSRLEIADQAQDWTMPALTPRRAGVSAFGFGGTNAHLVLESVTAPMDHSPICEASLSSPLMLNVSAATVASLELLLTEFSQRLRSLSINEARTLCSSVSRHRAQLPERIAVIGDTVEQLLNGLSNIDKNLDSIGAFSIRRRVTPGKRRIAFLFTGQGAQYPGMAVAMYQSESLFRKHLQSCDEILRPLLGVPLIDILNDAQDKYLKNTRFAQPALVAVELGIARLWQHYGVTPSLLLGHSVGEYAAACFAGVLSLEDTLTLVAERGRLMAEAPGQGAMLSVSASVDNVLPRLQALGLQLDLASYNAPNQIVLSGALSEIEHAQIELKLAGIASQRLAVSHAFHSRLMDPILPAFRALAKRIKFHSPTIPLISSAPCAHQVSDPEYWVQQLSATVQFSQGLHALAAEGADTFIEIGPGRTLVDLGQHQLKSGHWIHTMVRSDLCNRKWTHALAEAFVAGVRVTMPVAPGERTLLDELPLYPFDRQDHWFPKTTRIANRQLVSVVESASWPGQKIDIANPDWFGYETQWPAPGLEYLSDHCIDGQVLMPGSGFVSFMLFAAASAGLNVKGNGFELQALSIQEPLSLDVTEPVRLQVLLQLIDEGAFVQVFSRNQSAAGWTLHACAEVKLLLAPSASPVLTEVATNLPLNKVDFYTYWDACGMSYGPTFQAVQSLSISSTTAFAHVALVPISDGQSLRQGFDTIILDAAFQSLGGLLRDHLNIGSDVLMPLPVAIESFKLFAPLSAAVYVKASLRAVQENMSSVEADILLCEPDGRVLAEISCVRFRMVRRNLSEQLEPQLSEVHWASEDLSLTPSAAPSTKMLVGEVIPALLAATNGSLNTGLSLHDLPALMRHIGQRIESADASTHKCRVTLLLTLQQQPESPDAEALIAQAAQHCIVAQKLICAIADSEWATQVRLCWVTQHAMGSDVDSGTGSIAVASVLGMLRCAGVELPHLDLRLIDMAKDASETDWRLALHVLDHLDEPQIRVRSGKLSLARLRSIPPTADSWGQALDSQGAYLITGGTGTLGLAFCEWLAHAGARHLVLLSRFSQVGSKASSRLDVLRAIGVSIELVSGDIGQELVVNNLIKTFGRTRPPLRGVIHAAGVLKDRPFVQLSVDDWVSVTEAKCAGAWHLDRATREISLDFFVFCSSVASVLGSAGQANYAAANAMLEAIGEYRLKQGFPCLVVHWGPWDGSGMASEVHIAARMRQLGITPMSATFALRGFATLPLSGANALLMSCQSEQMIRVQPSAFRRALWRDLQVTEASTSLVAPLPSAELLISLESSDAIHTMARALGELTAIVLRQRTLPGAERPEALFALRLSDLGLDSLMAMDLRNRVRKWIGVDLPAHLLISGSSIGEVAQISYEQLLLQVIQIDYSGELTGSADEEFFVL